MDDALDKVRAFDVGGVDYITKPFQTKEILARVQNQLQICHLQQQLQQQNQHLEKLNQELTASNQELEQFAYVVSHDLKQPLQLILGFATLLHRHNQNSESKLTQGLAQIVKSSIRMRQLIDELLTYSRGGAQLKLKPTNCNLVLDRVLEDIQTAIADSNATINYNSLPTVIADETQLAILLLVTKPN